MHAVHCPCGATVQAETDDELVTGVEQHLTEKHPELVGKYTREQILSMAHTH